MAVVLAVLVVMLLRRRKRRPVAVRRQTPEEIAQAALALLLAENLPGRGLVKEFYLRLTGIVRQYVEDTTGIRAPEQTTEEFLRDMRSRAAFPPERSVRLAEFLEAADLIKYAGQQPEEGQVDQAIARAHEFVNLKPSPDYVIAGGGRIEYGSEEQGRFRAGTSILFLVLADPRTRRGGLRSGGDFVRGGGPRRFSPA